MIFEREPATERVFSRVLPRSRAPGRHTTYKTGETKMIFEREPATELVFKPRRQFTVGVVKTFPDGRMAVWNPARGWIPIWDGTEHVRR